MLYLLGGAPRAGKFILAQRLLHERRVPYLPLDMLMIGFARGVPYVDGSRDFPGAPDAAYALLAAA
jgi:hypothetical protein